MLTIHHWKLVTTHEAFVDRWPEDPADWTHWPEVKAWRCVRSVTFFNASPR